MFFLDLRPIHRIFYFEHRRAFFDILPHQLNTFAGFFQHLISLDFSRISAHDCLLLIAELAFPAPSSPPSSSLSPTDISATAASSSAFTAESSYRVILLGVDEISKSECEVELLKLIGKISDERLLQRIVVLPIVTSLSQSLLFQGLTGTDRVVNFIPLPVYLPGADAMLMDKLKLQSRYAPIIETLCRSLGNHGRMLEVLHDILDPASTNPQSHALQTSFMRDEGTAVDPILRAVAAHGGIHYFHLLGRNPASMIVPVCFALLGQSLCRDEPLQGCTMTPDELQVQGIFIGDAKSLPGHITPIMSHFQVLIWAEAARDRPWQSPELYLLANTLVEILSLKHPFSGSKFETFHAGMCLLVCFRARMHVRVIDFLCALIYNHTCFLLAGVELVRRLCYRLTGIPAPTLLEFFKLDPLDSETANRRLPTVLADVFHATLDFQGDFEALQAKGKRLVTVRAESVSPSIPDNMAVSVETAAPGQHLYDIVIHQRLKPSGVVTIVTQCKWSDKDDQKDQERLDFSKQGTTYPFHFCRGNRVGSVSLCS